MHHIDKVINLSRFVNIDGSIFDFIMILFCCLFLFFGISDSTLLGDSEDNPYENLQKVKNHDNTLGVIYDCSANNNHKVKKILKKLKKEEKTII